MAIFSIGDLISFTYPAVHQMGTQAHDKFPAVFVLHNNWQGLMHGLNTNYMSDDEINTFRMIIDPFFEMKYKEALAKKNPNAFHELERIITSSHNPRVTSPRDFYVKVVRPFIVPRGYDPYRKYVPAKMTNIRILQKEYHMSGKDSYAQYRREQEKAIAKGKSPEAIIYPHIQREFIKSLRQTKDPREREKLLQWYRDRVDKPGAPTKVIHPGDMSHAQPPPSGGALRNIFQWYKDRFSPMRGPRLPTFKK